MGLCGQAVHKGSPKVCGAPQVVVACATCDLAQVTCPPPPPPPPPPTPHGILQQLVQHVVQVAGDVGQQRGTGAADGQLWAHAIRLAACLVGGGGGEGVGGQANSRCRSVPGAASRWWAGEQGAAT
jgi:hypothetical protein